jgi:hypothetical protein
MAPRSLVPRLPARTLAAQVGMTNKWLIEQVSEDSGADICQRTVGKDSLFGFGPITLIKRPVRIRMQGIVGAGGEKPRLPDYLVGQKNGIMP